MDNFDYRKELIQILDQRQKDNPLYSGRAFARDLGISITALHGVLNQTRHLSKGNLELVSKALSWSFQQSQLAYQYTQLLDDPTPNLMDEDEFQFIADWIHLAIMNLAKIKNIKLSSLPERLGVEIEVIEEAVNRLERLQHIRVDKANNTIERIVSSFGVKSKTPSKAIQTFHNSNLAKAQNAVQNIPIEQRNFLTIAAPTHSSKIPELNKLIDEFRKQALSLFDCNNADQVYFLNIQLYPVSQSVNNSSLNNLKKELK